MHMSWTVFRLTLPPAYYRSQIYKQLERSIVAKIEQAGNLEKALEQGFLQEVHPTRNTPPLRRFVIVVQDARQGHEVSLGFCLKFQNKPLIA